MDEAGMEQDVIELSAKKWQWMSDQDMPALTTLFHPKAVFVHMGGAWGTERELDIIKEGFIHYKHAEVHTVSASVIGATAIVLNRVTLLAVVGGNEVTNLFEVTEAYAQVGEAWTMVALAFTKQLTHDEQPA
jgi:hypothetical protein